MIKYIRCICKTCKELIKAYFKSQGQGRLLQLLLLALDLHKIKLVSYHSSYQWEQGSKALPPVQE